MKDFNLRGDDADTTTVKKVLARHGWLAVLIGVAVAVSVVALWLGASSRAAEAQLDLVHASTSNLYRLSALEWQAIANQGLDDDLRDEVDSAIKSIRGTAFRLAADGVIDQSTRATLDGFVAAVEREIDLLETGEVEAAIEADRTVVDPLFDEATGILGTVAEMSRAHAAGVSRITTVALVLAIAAGVGVTGYMVYVRERASQTADLLVSKDRFIASVSHELRTPLAAVLGFSAILRDDFRGLDEAERTELASTIAREAYDLSGIVEDLLVAARTEMDSIHISRVPVDLKANTAQVLEVLPDELKTRVRLGDQPNAMPVWGDPARLRQAVRNLVSNALRYGGENVQIDFDRSREQAILSVTDDGLGIPDAEIDRIFLPYETAHSPGSVPSSVGLGLSVTRQLVELMGGSITYHREKGSSVFEIRLPLVTALEETRVEYAHQATNE